MSRRRRRLAVALGLVLAAGLASRRLDALPSFVEDHAGDALWVTAVALGLALIWPARPAAMIALAAFTIAVAVELSQLWSPAWLEELRENDLAALVLGRGWLWGDLVRYAGGAVLGYGVLRLVGSAGYDDEPESAVVTPRPR